MTPWANVTSQAGRPARATPPFSHQCYFQHRRSPQAEKHRTGNGFDFDVIVIGSGFGGSAPIVLTHTATVDYVFRGKVVLPEEL